MSLLYIPSIKLFRSDLLRSQYYMAVCRISRQMAIKGGKKSGIDNRLCSHHALPQTYCPDLIRTNIINLMNMLFFIQIMCAVTIKKAVSQIKYVFIVIYVSQPHIQNGTAEHMKCIFSEEENNAKHKFVYFPLYGEEIMVILLKRQLSLHGFHMMRRNWINISHIPLNCFCLCI
jgi:hypothetical protein